MDSIALPSNGDNLGNSATPAPFPYRLAAIDIDDTLVGADRIISPENAQAIATLRSLGVRVLLASGRSHANMAPFHRELGLDTPLISANGALLREVESGAILREHSLPAGRVAELIAEGRARGVSVLLYTVTGVAVDEETRFTEYDQSRNAEPQRKVADLLAVAGESIPKMIWMGESSVVDSLIAPISEQYAGALNVTRTDPEYLEFMPPGISKATGLADAAEIYGVGQAETLAVGDGNNDAEMIGWAGFGMAMPHAKDSAKAAARYVIPDGEAKDALARGIAHLLRSHAVSVPESSEATRRR